MGKTTTSATGASSSRAGSVVSQQFATDISVDQLVTSLTKIEKIYYDPSRQAYLAETTEGLVAVSLDGQHSLTHNGQVSPEVLQAAYAQALGEQAAYSPLDAADNVLMLGDLRDELADVNNQLADYPHDGPQRQELLDRQQELQAQYATLARELMADELPLCQEEINAAGNSGPVSRRLAMKQRAQNMGQKLRGFIRGQNEHGVSSAQALVIGVNEQGELNMAESKFDESLQSAIALGGEHLIPEVKIGFMNALEQETDENGDPKFDDQGNPVYKLDADGNPIEKLDEQGKPIIVSTGEIEANAQWQEAMELFQSRVVEGGTRLVILSGPPSSGKDTFAEQMAGVLGMPVVMKNMGPGYDISDALGGEGLGPVDTYDDEGNISGTVAGSRRIIGNLTETAQHRAAFIMTEIEGMEDDLVRLNTLFGSRVGEPDKRTVSAGSITDDEEIVPHEDFMMFITYNPGHDDIKLPSSVAARALNISFEYAPAEEEASVVSKMASAICQQDSTVEGIQERGISAEDVRPVVDLVRRMRNQHATDPHIWKDHPDMRQAAHIFHDLLFMGYQKNANNWQSSLRRSLEYVLPGSMELPVSERQARLDDLLKDYESELVKITKLGFKLREKAEGNG